MASAPDNARLHELLKAAARELKAAQQELADERDLHESARKALDGERAKTKELNEKLLDLQQSLRKAQTEVAEHKRRELSDNTSRTVVGLSRPTLSGLDAQTTIPPDSRPSDDSTNVSRLDPEVLEQRVKALDQSLADSEAEVKQYKQKVTALEGELAALKELARPGAAPAELSAEVQHQLDEERARAEVAEERVATLEAELAVVKAQLSAEEERAAVAEADLATTREQLVSEQARAGDVAARGAALEAELATVRDAAARAAELEGQLATAKARSWELEQQHMDMSARAEAAEVRVGELTPRLAQVESDLSGVRARRDELNVELGRLESDRKKLQARLTELEAGVQAVRDEEGRVRAALEARLGESQAQLEARHAEAMAQLEARRAEADGQFHKEKDKHQITAQRLLEARQKTRELETQLSDAQAQLQAGEKSRAQLEAEHAAQLKRERESQAATIASLQATVSQLEKDLAHATEEWHHTNRQYEQLHKEMLLLLDQRDEARRQLAALQGRR